MTVWQTYPPGADAGGGSGGGSGKSTEGLGIAGVIAPTGKSTGRSMDGSTAGGTAQSPLGGPPVPSGGQPYTGPSYHSGDAQILVHTPGATWASGIFPDWFTPTMSYNDLLIAPTQMSGEQRAVIQKMLWMAGYYGPEAIINGVLPPLGYWDSTQQAVWDSFITSQLVSTTQGLGPDGDPQKGSVQLSALDQALRDRVSANQGLLAQGAANFSIPGREVALTDPGSLEVTVQSFASKYLGRELSAEEVQVAVGEMRAEQIAVFEKQYQAYLNNAVAEIERSRLNAGQMGLDWAEPIILTGGGLDSTALKYGTELAHRWGGTVKATANGAVPAGPQVPLLSDGLGMTVHFADPAQASRFAEWAQAQMNAQVPQGVQPDGATPAAVGGGIIETFIYDERKGDVTIRFREGALGTALDSFAPTGQTPNETSAFLKALQDPNLGQERYLQNTTHSGYQLGSMGGTTGQGIGAYGILESNWRRMAKKLGIPLSNMSPGAQDAVARALAEDLYARYGNWEDVAIAWKFGDNAVAYQGQWRQPYEQEAAKVVDRMGEVRNVPPGAWDLPDYEKAWMAASGQGGTMSGGLTMVEGYDEQGSALRTLQQHQAVEKQGWGAVDGFGTMARIMGRLGGGYSSG